MSLRVVEARVVDLKLNPRNPRLMRPERRKQFLRALAAERELLEARPLIARPDGTVIAGNMRLQGARELGWETIPTVFADPDELRAATWIFLDNRSFGEDDEDLAAELLAELAAKGGDLDLTGYTRPETDAMLRRALHRDRDPDQLPPLPQAEPDSKPGAVYQLGPHRLMCADATNPCDVAELLAGAQPLLIATDPPYGVELDNGWRDRAGLTSGKHASERAGGRAARVRAVGHMTTRIASDTRADWSEALALAPSCSVAYVWHASAHACTVRAGLERIGFEVRQQIIWDKGLFALSRQDYHWQHEPAWYAKRPGAKSSWLGPKNQSTVWEAASPKMVMASGKGAGDAKVDHPTQKPVILFSRPIENHLSPGEALYDPFAGSGTALIAAELTGRVCYAMELDPRCCDLIRARYKEFSRGR